MSGLTSDEEVTKKTYDKFGAVWSRNNDTKDYWLKYMRKLWTFAPSGRLLDIGCGSGRDGIGLSELGYDYNGVDISETLLAIAKKRLPDKKFYNQSVFDLSLPGKFDAFWLAAVLLHVPKNRIDEALAEVKRILKPGAAGFIAIKDGEGEGLQKDELENVELERFFSYWNKEAFSDVLSRNQFKILEYDYFPVSAKTRWHCFFVRLS